jgi:MFS family permease
MYVTLRDRPRLAPSNGRRAKVAVPVVLLGITSMFTDISSEMVAAILPLFVTVGLGLSPLAFGVVDGLYQGISAATRLAGGYVADRTRRPKAVATTGYVLSAVSKLALLPVGSLTSLSAAVAVDRTGKGIRTAPRDALIAGASPAGSLGHAFGVHRALDTSGALIGPLLAFALLALLPGNFDAVFVVSFCFAVLGVAVIALLVREQPLHTVADSRPRGGDVARLLRQPGIRSVLLTAGLLSLASVSDGFLYLALQDREGLPAAVFPLLFVGTAVVYMSLAIPIGRLADRIGRVRVFLGGQLLLAGAYLLALLPVPGMMSVVATISLLGVYYAATDGVLAAIVSGLVPAPVRASGLAAVQTVVAAGRLVSALAFGAIWTVTGVNAALAAFLAALLVAVPIATRLLHGTVTSGGTGS